MKRKEKSLEKDVPITTTSSPSQVEPKEIQQFKKLLEAEDDIFGITPYYLHSGNLALDYIISGRADGTGGWPGGKVVEVFGPPSTGKTLLIDKAGAEMQKIGGVFIMADIENRWNRAFAKRHGVNVDKVICFTPTTVEEFTIKIDRLLEAAENTKFLIALDSLARLSTIKEVDDVGEGDIKADQGRKAQKIHAAMRVLPAKIRKTNSILMVANHIIDNPAQIYSTIKHTPGGRGIPFGATVRVDLSQPKSLVVEGKARPIGVSLHAKCVKNSETVPFGECDIKMLWSLGVSKYSGLADILVDCGIINKNGAWLEFKKEKFYEKNLSKIIEANPEILTDEKLIDPYFMREE